MASFELPDEFLILNTPSGLGKPTFKIQSAPLLTATFLLTVVYSTHVQGTSDCSCSFLACTPQILTCCMCAMLTPDPILALLQLYPLELVETPLAPSRSGYVWWSHHTSMVPTMLHCGAHNHCPLTCCCMCRFADSMVIKTNTSDPDPE